MDRRVLSAFSEALRKSASRRDVAALLAAKAERLGVDPATLPAIRQVKGRVLAGDRGRAAEIAGRVRDYLKQKKPGP
jgi:hypothetical protein